MPEIILSQSAQKVIRDYLTLPFPGVQVSCPYFNNKRSKVRGALRVLVGKGTPREILEEMVIIALREKTDLENLSAEELKIFLVNHNLGVDCSGFAYHVLDAEFKTRGKGSLAKHLKFSNIKNPLRKILAKIRPAENTNVKILADDINSNEIALLDVEAGDLITMQDSNKQGNPDHVLLVHEVIYENYKLKAIHYSHSYQFSTDGKYGHGMKQGKINIQNPNGPLLEQNWSEQETWQNARDAKSVKIRRIK